MRRLAVDYAFEYAGAGAVFRGQPCRSRRLGRRHRARAGASTGRGPAIVAMLEAQQARRDSPPAARAAVAALADPSTVAIVTGQQAGLFGGPLFTLLKAVTADPVVRAAQPRARRDGRAGLLDRRRGSRLGRDCRMRRAGVRSDAAARVEVRAPEGAGERTVASLRYTDAIVRRPGGADGDAAAPRSSPASLLDALRDAYQPGRGVAEAFGRFIDRVLGPHGLVVYDASDPAAKPFAAPIFLRELERARRDRRAWRQRPAPTWWRAAITCR